MAERCLFHSSGSVWASMDADTWLFAPSIVNFLGDSFVGRENLGLRLDLSSKTAKEVYVTAWCLSYSDEVAASSNPPGFAEASPPFLIPHTCSVLARVWKMWQES